MVDVVMLDSATAVEEKDSGARAPWPPSITYISTEEVQALVPSWNPGVVDGRIGYDVPASAVTHVEVERSKSERFTGHLASPNADNLMVPGPLIRASISEARLAL
jgi:hypothetical protein